ncbi:ATP-binding protein [Streptomyces sp. CA-250714]|uniref:ATP-binding protein n=1 Tax=Streptomyces sp. CA-250714 TaxID=3240060 RepID=UPI003D91D398
MTIELTLLDRVAYRGQEVTAPRLRGLLALLAADPRTGCSTGWLVEGLWPLEQPERPGKALQVLVSRARTQLGAEVIVSTPSGYRLGLSDDQVDSSALLRYAAASAERARAGDHAAALAQAEAGLALWEGEDGGAADEGLYDPVAALRAERAPVRRSLARALALARARLGRYAEAVGALAELAAEQPRDEEVLAELLRAEAATAGSATALARYETYRRALREELGTDPGAALAAVHQELLKSEAPQVRQGIPHEPNPLLGRDAEVAAVKGLLRTSRAVTITGPGGLGKTRLAHAVAWQAEQRTVHCVPLAGVIADSDVAGEVASVLGLGDTRHSGAGHPAGGPQTGGPQAGGADPAAAAIAGALGAGPALLVLDNCEHVVDGVAALVRSLLALARDVRVLATSRAPLGLTSESVFRLPELAPTTAAELFRQRARAARPSVELPPDEVERLCRQLDGLPLAVELAAARVRVLSVPEIADRLSDRFRLLRGGARDVPERHRTLRAVVEWSWNLLEPAGRAALRTLSVFPGGFTGEAAEHVLGDKGDGLWGEDGSGGDVLFLLEQLADQSLLKAADTAAGVRFSMLETVREFCAEQRSRAGEDEAVTERFLGWARDFGLAHHDALFRPDPMPAWQRVRAEQDNLVLALRQALARDDGPTLAATTAVLTALGTTETNYFRLLSVISDTGHALSHFRPEPAYVEVTRTAAVLSTATLFMGYGPHAVRQLVVLRRLPPAPPDTLLRALTVVFRSVPDIRGTSSPLLVELCAGEEPLLVGVAEGLAGYLWEYEHDAERALVSARRMHAALDPLGIPSVQILTNARISELCLRTERGAEAVPYLLAGLTALRRLGDGTDSIGVRWGLVLANLQRGAIEEAEHWLEQAMAEQPYYVPDFFTPDLGARAEIALARGLTEVGLGLWRQAVDRLRNGSPIPGRDPFMEPWWLELQSVAVVAHAQHGRLEPVEDLVDQLRQRLRMLIDRPGAVTGSPEELPVHGTVLLALGMAGLARGDTSAVRLVALAERLRVLRDFHPTMSSARSRQAAEQADGAAYAAAVAEYAALGPAELRAAVLAAVR